MQVDQWHELQHYRPFAKINNHWVAISMKSDKLHHNCPEQRSTSTELQLAQWSLCKDQQAFCCNQHILIWCQLKRNKLHHNRSLAKIDKQWVAINMSSSDASQRATSCITFVPLHGLTSSEFWICLSLSDAGSCCHTQKLAFLASLLA